MKIAICDDNMNDRDLIENMLKDNPFYRKATVFKFENGTELLNSHNKNHFNIILLDVDMPGYSGLEIGSLLRQKDIDTILIFITNYPQYAIDAYDCNAYHYLLKPIDKTKFDSVINKAIRTLLIQKAKIDLKIQEETIIVSLSDIYYIESSKLHKVTYHTTYGKHTVRDTLSSIIDRISHFGFYQVQRGIIVNLNKISKITKEEIIFNNGMTTEISPRKLKEIELVFTDYLEKTL